MQVLVEVLPNDRVRVDADANLLQEGIDVGIQSRFTTFLHHNHGATAILDVVSDVLKLVPSERQARAAQEEQLCITESFCGDLSFVYGTL